MKKQVWTKKLRMEFVRTRHFAAELMSLQNDYTCMN